MERTRKITWAPSAYRDFKEGFDYVAGENAPAARAWAKQILSSIEKLERFPQLGRLIPEIGKSRYREIVAGEYRIFHEVREKEILIFRILHSKRLFRL